MADKESILGKIIVGVVVGVAVPVLVAMLIPKPVPPDPVPFLPDTVWRPPSPVVIRTADISGRWFSQNSDFYFSIEQKGKWFTYQTYNAFNGITGQGSGSIRGRAVHLSGTSTGLGIPISYTGQFNLEEGEEVLSGSFSVPLLGGEIAMLTRE